MTWALWGPSVATREDHRDVWPIVCENLDSLCTDAELHVMAAAALSDVGDLVDVEMEPPCLPPPCRASSTGSCEGLLGERFVEVPASVHAAMEALAAQGSIPITTPEQRARAKGSTMVLIGVPAALVPARDHAYIHPVLGPPAGYRWVFKNKVWALRLRGG